MKFRCAWDSFISERNTPWKYTDIAQGQPFGSKQRLVSFRENDASARWGKFRRRYQRESRKGCTRAPIPHSTRPCLIIQPVSILHTSLSNGERVAHWETTGSSNWFQRTYERRRVCLPRSADSMPSCFHEFVKAHGHSVPRNRSAAVERRGRTEIAKDFYCTRQRAIFNARTNCSRSIFFLDTIFPIF